MVCTLNFSIGTADLLSMELDCIVFSDMSAGSSLGMGFEVYDGDTNIVLDSWFTTYYADSRGEVRLNDLSKLWNSYILYRRRVQNSENTTPATLMGGIKVKISYSLDGDTAVSCYRRIWYSARKTGMTLASLNSKIPFVSLRKRTFMDAEERLNIAGPTSKTVTVQATYLSQGGVTGTIDFTLSADESDVFGDYRDVSPATILSHLPSGATLLKYYMSISGSLSRCTYEVERNHYAQRTELCYVNRWGVYETLWLVGSERWKPERSADFGYAGDERAALDVEVSDTYEVSTGYVNDTVLEQLRDLSASPTVWMYAHSDQSWRKVVVESVEFERVCPSNEVRSGMVTYHFADNKI